MKQNQIIPSVSLATVCMGRLHHLKETLPRNLNWNINYPNIEIVLLDYNSPDGLEDWVKSNFMQFINDGKLVYYKYTGSEYFKYAHSRNLLLKLSTGEYFCNVDADNYTGNGFAQYLSDELNKVDFLIGCQFIQNANLCYPEGDFLPLKKTTNFNGVVGRIASRREYLLSIGGYWEEIENSGPEDIDLYQRLRCAGYSFKSIEERYLFCISHSTADKVAFLKEKDMSKSWKEKLDKSLENLKSKNFVYDQTNIGKGIVYKNFERKPIFL
jgi:hypothetical protein